MALSIRFVMVIGLCWRFPVGKPEALSWGIESPDMDITSIHPLCVALFESPSIPAILIYIAPKGAYIKRLAGSVTDKVLNRIIVLED